MGATCYSCIGGTNLKECITKLETGVQIVVGTPGRVNDMIKRNKLSKLSFTLSSLFLIFVLFKIQNILNHLYSMT